MQHAEQLQDRPALDAIKEADAVLSREAERVRKLRERLNRAKQALAARPRSCSVLASLLEYLRGLPPPTSDSPIPSLVDTLQRRLEELKSESGRTLASDLQRQCEVAGLAFKRLHDRFAVGPFAVGIVPATDSAELDYAKLTIVKGIPLDAAGIVEQAKVHKAALIDAPVKLGEFTAQVEEAMRVALARHKKAPKTELRVELPAVYREMVVIKQFHARAKGKGSGEYPLARFVVELQAAIRSDENQRGDIRLRAETAVLENTKNAKKSVFVPNDFLAGYGEGTYYQALVMRPK